MSALLTADLSALWRKVHMNGRVSWYCRYCGTFNVSSIRAFTWKDRCANDRCHRVIELEMHQKAASKRSQPSLSPASE